MKRNNNGSFEFRRGSNEKRDKPEKSRRDISGWIAHVQHFCRSVLFILLAFRAHTREKRKKRTSVVVSSYVNTHVGRCRPVSPRGVNLGHSASASGLEISCERTHEARERSSTINPHATEMRLTYTRAWLCRANYCKERWCISFCSNMVTLRELN